MINLLKIFSLPVTSFAVIHTMICTIAGFRVDIAHGLFMLIGCVVFWSLLIWKNASYE